MSVHVISWVLSHSEERLGNRLVLIVLADHAAKDGSDAFPSVNTIAQEARMSQRAVRYALRALAASGSIEATGTHESGTVIYRIQGVQDLQGVQETTDGPTDFAPEPSLEPSLVREANASLTPRSVKTRKPDKLWDALVDELGPVETKSERGRRNKALKELREIGVREDELRTRIATYRRRWPEIELTATGIAANWSVLGQPRTMMREVRGSHGSTFIKVAV